jgi:alkylation response protein AidB-like acyl-CoA dehydrogenase
MEFDWSKEEQSFRAALKSFLAETLGSDWHGHDEADPAAFRAAARSFSGQMAERGWLTEHWPVDYGGRDASPWRYAILGEELWPIGEPRGSQYMNVNWIGPAIMAFGTDAQKSEHLRRISAGDVFWCQGFSEAGAGSDLVALRCRATRDGDDYVVSGSKLWTSWADTADYCILLVRTGTEDSRHRGITVLLMPMDLPGVEVRPIAGFVGDHAFSELVLDDVRVPVSCRLGGENEGWNVVRHALSFERIGAPHYQLGLHMLEEAVTQAKENGTYDDPEVLGRIGQVYEAFRAARMLFYRVVDLRAHGQPPSADSNVARVAMTDALAELGSLLILIYGLDGLVRGSAGDMRKTLRYSVAAGATEIQLDQIASRFLFLPKAP